MMENLCGDWPEIGRRKEERRLKMQTPSLRDLAGYAYTNDVFLLIISSSTCLDQKNIWTGLQPIQPGGYIRHCSQPTKLAMQIHFLRCMNRKIGISFIFKIFSRQATAVT